jgi:hypothetical protein
LAVRWAESEAVENQGAAIVQAELDWLPTRALVAAIGIGIGGIPRTVEPVKVGFVVRNPFLNRQPGWLDGFHGLDIEGRRWRAGELDNAFPQAVEAEEKFDLLGALYGTCEFHGSLAAGALERIGTPDFENEVAPEGTHGAGGLFWRGRD